MKYAEVFYKRRRKKFVWGNHVFLTFVVISTIAHLSQGADAMSVNEMSSLREKTKEMFFHAYDSYMRHAYPADELMPLSCKGRYRGTEPNRGDIDDSLGNYTLTLVDTLDTLFLMNETEKFETAVRHVIESVRFDSDIIVSFFEANIRVLGGLLGGHIAAEELKMSGKSMSWYKGDLLKLAEDIGRRLLPAFNTSTGIPHPRINLRHGIDRLDREEQLTCTACGGSMILEFAALSRLTGNPIYEQKAAAAMNALWEKRNVASNLMGTVINIQNGDWVRREAGVGAGIDSYYEYLFKAYVLLGESHYLDRFNLHYEAIMKYVKVWVPFPLLVDVLMHRPFTRAKSFMDALLAFWPGLQVMAGDLKPAIALHEILYQVVQRHSFLPEAFTTDFSVHWGQHPLRPEFIESTYFLYKATRDPYYLQIGAQVLNNIERHARVSCGYAAISDVRTMKHEDQLDSFVLAETFKYLYLLFTEASELPVNLDRFVFTTEAHLLPLSLAKQRVPNESSSSISTPLSPESTSLSDSGAETALDMCGRQQISNYDSSESQPSTDSRAHHRDTCPNLSIEERLVGRPLMTLAHQLRLPLRDTVNRFQPQPHMSGSGDGQEPLLRAEDFQVDNPRHITIIKRMGIQLVEATDGKMHQLLHNPSSAENEKLGADGVKFMTDMIRLTQQGGAQGGSNTNAVPLRYVQLVGVPHLGSIWYKAGPAQFGVQLNEKQVRGRLFEVDPVEACSSLSEKSIKVASGRVALVRRGGCMFIEKARRLQEVGVIGVIVTDNKPGTSSETHGLFAMSGDGRNDVTIPMVFIFTKEAESLSQELSVQGDKLEVLLTNKLQDQGEIIRHVVNRYLQTKNSVPTSSDSSTSSSSSSVGPETPPLAPSPSAESESNTATTNSEIENNKKEESQSEKSIGVGRVQQGFLFTPKDSVTDGIPWVTVNEVKPQTEFSIRILYNERISKLHESSGKSEAALDALWEAVEDLLLETTNLQELPSRRFYLDYLRLLFVHAESSLPLTSDILQVPVPRVLTKLARALISQKIHAPYEQGLITSAEEEYFVGLEIRYNHLGPSDKDGMEESSEFESEKNEERKDESKDDQHEPVVRNIYDGEANQKTKEDKSTKRDEL